MKEPTIRKAAILTTDSAAIASISPSWCSVASICLVPNRIANTAIVMAMMKVRSPSGSPLEMNGAVPVGPMTVVIDCETAFSCSAI